MNKRFVCCICAVFLSGCSIVMKKEEPRPAVVPAEQAPEYKVEQVRLGTIESTATVFFSFMQSGGNDYSFDSDGYLGKVNFKPGDQVFAGDILAVMDGYDEAKAEYDKYTGEKEDLCLRLDSLERELDKGIREYEIRHKYGFMSDEEYAEKTVTWHDEYDGRIKELQDKIYILDMRIERAEGIAGKGAIYSEKNGIVTSAKTVYSKPQRERKWWEPQEEADDTPNSYNKVKAGETVISVADSGSEVFVAETEYADRFKPGEEITLTLNNGNTLLTVVGESGENKVVLIPEQADTSLNMGLRVNYDLPLERKEGINVISKSSVHVTDGRYYVYVLGDDGFRQMRWITTGVSNTQEIEVIEGLKTGDMVIKR